jgi:TRAP-type C4-dicarboxylate transport system permease small subunit
MMLLTVIMLLIDTAGYIFSQPIYGVTEMAMFTIVGAAYLGLGYTEQTRAHIRVMALTKYFKRRTQKGLEILCGLLSFVVIAITTYAAFLKAAVAFSDSESLAGLVLFPLAPIRFVIAISLLLFWFQILANVIIDVANFIRSDQIAHKISEDT